MLYTSLSVSRKIALNLIPDRRHTPLPRHLPCKFFSLFFVRRLMENLFTIHLRKSMCRLSENFSVQAINLNTRIFSILFRKHNGDIRRMPPLLLRKITRKSTAVGVVFAFVFYLLIVEFPPYGMFCSLCVFFMKNAITGTKEYKQKLPKPCNRRGLRLRFTPGE